MNKYLQESYDESLRENALLKAKLEQAEKALLAYQEFEQRSNCNWCGDGVRDVVNKALQAIRGGLEDGTVLI